MGTICASIRTSTSRVSPYFPRKLVAFSLMYVAQGEMTMRAAFGAVAGALAVGAMLVSYNMGARNAFNGQMTAPTTQMLVGPDGIARPYLVQAGQNGFGQPLPAQPMGWSPYSTTIPGAVAPTGIRGLSGVSGAVSGADAICHRTGGRTGAGASRSRRSGRSLKTSSRGVPGRRARC